MNEELQNILEKVRCMYQKYGIKSITMDDVSRELGISKKTLYQHVADKLDLVQKVMDLEIELRLNEFDSVFCCDKNAIEELVEMHRLVNLSMKEYNPSTDYDLRKYYPDIHKKMFEIRRKRMFENVLNNLKKGKLQEIYRADLNESIIAKLTVVRILQMIDNETIPVLEFTSTDFFSEVLIYHIRGIANENGLKILEENIDKLKNPEKYN